uniref:Uncharacterized protein n=1 Tax=Globodera rostochiensis TaxID=31243 RepID=A0A914GXG8_GLORO
MKVSNLFFHSLILLPIIIPSVFTEDAQNGSTFGLVSNQSSSDALALNEAAAILLKVDSENGIIAGGDANNSTNPGGMAIKIADVLVSSIKAIIRFFADICSKRRQRMEQQQPTPDLGRSTGRRAKADGRDGGWPWRGVEKGGDALCRNAFFSSRKYSNKLRHIFFSFSIINDFLINRCGAPFVWAISSSGLSRCIPTAGGTPQQCAHCQQSIDFRGTPPMAFAQKGNVVMNGMSSSNRGSTASSTPPFCASFARSPTTGRRHNEGGEQRVTGIRALRRSRIFPTMEKRTVGAAALPKWEASAEWEDTGKSTAYRQTSSTTRKLFPPASAEHLPKNIQLHQQTNSWGDDRTVPKAVGRASRGGGDDQNGGSRAYFQRLVSRFDAALNLFTDEKSCCENVYGCARNMDLFQKAKEFLCISEQRIWRNRTQPNGRPLDRCHLRYEGGNGRSAAAAADRGLDVIRRLRELTVAMEEQNRRENGKKGEGGGHSTNVWRTKRRISLLGMRLNGRECEQRAEQVLDTLLVCSGQISNILERRPAFPSQFLGATAHVQFGLFDAMDEITRQLLDRQREKRLRVWLTVSRCFGELLRMGSVSWKSNEFPWKRFTLIAHLARFLHRFADVCDTSTQMLCIIEVEKARAFVAEEVGMNSAEWRATAREQLSRIELDLAECQRVQKWNELKLDTQIVRRRDNRTEQMGPSRKRNSAKLREWLQRMLLGGRKITNKMMGKGLQQQ